MKDVYLVGYSSLLRDGLQSLLEAAGHRVVGASDDPMQVIEEVSKLGPLVLLLDLHFAQRAGFELLRKLQRFPQSVSTVVLAASSQARYAQEAVRLGASGFVLTEGPTSVLLKVISEVYPCTSTRPAPDDVST